MTPKDYTSKLKANFEKMKEELPVALAMASRRYFVSSFDKQGWNGQGWVPRVKDQPWPILVKSGKLKSDVENAEIEPSWHETKVTAHNDYGEYHNEGTSKLPQREFMGDSTELEAILTGIIEAGLKNMFEQ